MNDKHPVMGKEEAKAFAQQYHNRAELGNFVAKINQWGLDRNITAEGGATVLSQMSKMMEEFAEFLSTYGKLEEVCASHGRPLEMLAEVLYNYNGSDAIEEDIELLHKLEDDFGDMLVCIINAMRLAGTDMETCLAKAWDDIKDRKGRMEGGKFIKEGSSEVGPTGREVVYDVKGF